jgi:hypothetical protein
MATMTREDIRVAQDRWNAAAKIRGEKRRHEKIEEAKKLGAALMELKAAKMTHEYPNLAHWAVHDPEIDVLELRYREAVAALKSEGTL